MKKRNPWIAICPGIKRQTLTSGKTMYQMLATLEPDSKMPAHQHSQEQIVHVLSGRMKLIVDGTPHEMKTGDSFIWLPIFRTVSRPSKRRECSIPSVRRATNIWRSTKQIANECRWIEQPLARS